MKLKVLNSNSAGNSYILYNDTEALLIECGVRFDKIKEALDFNLKKVVGCLVTHEHNDHCKAVNDVVKAGINVWTSTGTHEAMGTINSHKARMLHKGVSQAIGSFTVVGFSIQHDVKDPLGFLIHHPECGTVLFLTDTYYSKQVFPSFCMSLAIFNCCLPNLFILPFF